MQIFLRLLFSLFFLATLSHCGKVKQIVRGGFVEPSINESAATVLSSTYVFATDYASSGQLYLATLTNDGTKLINSGVTLLGSSAIIRSFDGLIFVLHDGFSTVSTDNVQIIDPADNFNTIAQYSVGNGTNPHDIAVSGSRAFIALYNPPADPENLDSHGRMANVIEMDLTSGNIVHRWSFHDFLNDDGDRNGNAEKLLLVDNILYVALQDLSANTFAANSNGLIGMIDVNTAEVLGAIPLVGRNPVGMSITTDKTTMYIANMATYNFALGDFDLTPLYGGIEVVDAHNKISLGLLADENLGGYVERVVSDASHVYAVLSEFDGPTFSYASRVVRLPHDFADLNDLEAVDDIGTDIREMTVDGKYLWLSRRKISALSGLSEPVLNVIDLQTLTPAGDSLAPAAPGMSFAVE